MSPNSEPDAPSFSGRWVARLNGRVIAQGDTREQALRAAKHSRPKEDPEILFMFPQPDRENRALIAAILDALRPGQSIHLVGGAVRDLLRGRSSHDLDFVVPSEGLAVARRVANQTGGAFFPLDAETDTARIIYQHQDGTRTKVDFAAYRQPDLAGDLAARDFTINAMALDPRTNALFDPLGGALDLREKRVRACSEDALVDDPVRVLRGVRLAAALGFSIQRETRQLMKTAAGMLPSVSPERLRDELFKMLDGAKPASCLRALDLLGALPYLLPELGALKGAAQPAPHVQDVWEHTLSLLRHLEVILAVLGRAEPIAPAEAVGSPEVTTPDEPGDLFTGLLAFRLGRYRQQLTAYLASDPASERTPRSVLLFAALYHDVAKPQTRAVHDGRVRFLGHDQLGAEISRERARALRLSNEEVARIGTLVAGHMRIHFYTNRLVAQGRQPSRRAIYRFFRDNGDAGVGLCLLALADLRATYEHTLPDETWKACLDVCRVMFENWWEKPQETVSPPALVNGHDIMQVLGEPPGPTIGRVLEAVREAQATGKLENATRDEALVFAREWLEQETHG